MPDTQELAEAIFALSKLSWRETAHQTSELTESEFLALDHLAAVDTATVGSVTAEIKVLPAQMSRIVRQLEKQGYVTCAINSDDKRKVDMTMTKEGKKVYKKYHQAKLAPLIEAFSRLSPKEQAQFMTLVGKMSAQ